MRAQPHNSAKGRWCSPCFRTRRRSTPQRSRLAHVAYVLIPFPLHPRGLPHLFSHGSHTCSARIERTCSCSMMMKRTARSARDTSPHASLFTTTGERIMYHPPIQRNPLHPVPLANPFGHTPSHQIHLACLHRLLAAQFISSDNSFPSFPSSASSSSSCWVEYSDHPLDGLHHPWPWEVDLMPMNPPFTERSKACAEEDLPHWKGRKEKE